ncbi:hypothetical protein PLESTB_000671600 [Pleodorina starrii]|uniref:Protein kinase domain-containing protein n=1 Tax=Pleodorina starrii TaxID=330485 RepID=A0A9W6F1Y6_9CHLO|nr:hypothetical protein PLESTM_000963000 [Pleodorina starrii]GLC52815.1 hypothetical protein PLESTB_000671600 [Pleodorina starrii]GLC65841.1 hypothetical protein PLESTF_000349000 [Pleodorina starrii]
MNSTKGRKDEIAAVTADELRSQLVLKKLVGKGGFAAVYLGTYKGQEVAVKVILAEHVSPESLQVKLLLREGQYMSRCTHKNIVKCHAVCQLPANFPGIEALGHRSSTWALVLDYIGGGSLAALMMKQMSQTRRAYTDYEAYCWIRGVADALNYLHNAPRPVMHRDVKADNVLLSTDEEGRPVAKLMDFGLMAALDGKNPLLRRRSVSATSAAGAGGPDGLGRTSTTSIGRASVGVGGGRNLSAPSVATYYNDNTHEAGKIFYLMDELPAPTVAALAGPAASRRVSMDFTSPLNANGRASSSLAAGGPSGAATPPAAAAGASTPGGGTTPLTSQFGFVTAAGRAGSFDTAPGAAPVAGGAAAASKPRSGLSPALPGGSVGTLVPLSEEASYHGNTAGYAAMLLHQQQQRRQQQQQRKTSQDAAAAAAAAASGGGGGGGGVFGRLSAGAASSLPSSLHGNTRPGSCSGGSPPGGMSPLAGYSPAASTHWPGEPPVASGSVRLRLVSEDNEGVTGGCSGGGDAAIALAAARLGRQVSQNNGSLVRMSAPQPTPMTPPPSAPVLPEDELPAVDAADEILRETACFTATASGSADGRRCPQPDDQQRVSRPSSANRLPPIIAVAKTHAAVDAEVTPREASFGSAATAAAAAAAAGQAASASGLHNSHNFNGTGGGGGSQPRPSHEAVPLVGVDGGERPNSAVGRRVARVSGGSLPSTPPLAIAPLSSAHSQVATPGSAAAAAAALMAASTTPAAAAAGLVERQSSQKSIGSTRSGTGNGYVNDGATAAGAGGGGGGGTMAGGGGSGGQFSIAALLQGRYEQDFQWVWRLTGQTGSCMYMAPEVYRNMPYNEKVDVFSFGVLMYEVFSRQLMLVSALNLRELRLRGLDTPEGYAQTVAEGYRPPKPLAMPEPLYELMSACWADDPCARPNMADVVETLRLLQEQYAPQATASAPACGCVIS